MKWIKASERHPPKGVDVVIRDNDGYTYADRTTIGWDKRIIDYEWLDESTPIPLTPCVELESALRELVNLKIMKDEFGEVYEYRKRKPLAWEKAKQLLNL